MSSCDYCKKKLNIVSFKCKCGYNHLCSHCRLASEHKCDFDYKKEGREQLKVELPVIIANKITKI